MPRHEDTGKGSKIRVLYTQEKGSKGKQTNVLYKNVHKKRNKNGPEYLYTNNSTII